MNQDRWNLLTVFRTAISEKQNILSTLADEDIWEKILLSAEVNQVLPMTVEAAERCGAPESILAPHRRQAMRLMARQAVRMRYMERLCAFLRERELSFLVLEGVLCGALYPRAEQYVSAEERFFIRGEDMARFQGWCSL